MADFDPDSEAADVQRSRSPRIVQLVPTSVYVRLRAGGKPDPFVPGHEPAVCIGLRSDGTAVALVQRDARLVDATELEEAESAR